jgi:alpha-beta hydrolase superfamily lysophospholipase
MHAKTLMTVGAALCAAIATAQPPMRTEPFSFVVEGRRLNGFIDSPANDAPTATVVIVPGDGRTNMEVGMYRDLSAQFVQMGLACCLWDKAGCGKSDGVYDDQQTVQESAREYIAGLAELRKRRAKGPIGLWSISRGGWIAPLVMKADKSVAFWISVSGVDDKDNNTYLLQENLRVQGRSEDVVRLLVSEYRAGNRLFWQGGAYEDYVRATVNLHRDPYYEKLHGQQYTKDEYVHDQAASMRKYGFDDATASIVLVPELAEILKTVSCPILALFGERDTQVDWRKTIAFYEKTIGANPRSDLSVKTFPSCGHPILKCRTCGIDYEDLKELGYQPCDGYYEAMSAWLRRRGLARQRLDADGGGRPAAPTPERSAIRRQLSYHPRPR